MAIFSANKSTTSSDIRWPQILFRIQIKAVLICISFLDPYKCDINAQNINGKLIAQPRFKITSLSKLINYSLLKSQTDYFVQTSTAQVRSNCHSLSKLINHSLLKSQTLRLLCADCTSQFFIISIGKTWHGTTDGFNMVQMPSSSIALTTLHWFKRSVNTYER